MRWNIDILAPTPPKVTPPMQVRRGESILRIKNLTLITPMLGGGVDSLKNDQDMPIRGQSVRGQLRFWWRTFQDCRNISDLQEKENYLWGNTKSASLVSVKIDLSHKGYDIPYPNNDYPDYALFALKNDSEHRKFSLKESIKFNLTIIFPEKFEQEILNTVKLWVLFGGIGARTRRGMGGLYYSGWSGSKDKDDIITWLNQTVSGKNDIQRSWPSLIGAQLVLKSENSTDVKKAWKKWIEKYRGFRQHRRDKKTGKISPFGKSTWPEPDTIRSFHKKGKLPDNAYFPRGAYGLPIIFHFPKKHIEINKEVAYQLQCHEDRWASPAILKVVKLDESTIMKICLLLNSPLPLLWCLRGHDKNENLPQNAQPLSSHFKRKEEPLNDQNPYTALLTHMADGTSEITLGGK